MTGLEPLWAESLHVLTAARSLAKAWSETHQKGSGEPLARVSGSRKEETKRQWPFGGNDPVFQASVPKSGMSFEALVLLLGSPWRAAELGTEKPRWAGNAFLSSFLCLENLHQLPHKLSARQLSVEGLTHCENTQMPLLRHPYSRHPNSRHPNSRHPYSSVQASSVWAEPPLVTGRCQDSLDSLSYRIHKIIKMGECDSRKAFRNSPLNAVLYWRSSPLRFSVGLFMISYPHNTGELDASLLLKRKKMRISGLCTVISWEMPKGKWVGKRNCMLWLEDFYGMGEVYWCYPQI